MAGRISPINLGDDDAPARLGELLRRRRQYELEPAYATIPAFWQERVKQAGLNDLSERTVRDLETGARHGRHSLSTIRKAALAYAVTPESMMDVLERRADKLVPADPAPSRAPAAAHAALPPMTDETRAAAARPWYDAIRDAIDRWLEANPGKRASEVPGATLFPDSPADARTWDDPNLRRTFTVSQMAWLLADIRRAEAERASGRNGSGLAGA